MADAYANKHFLQMPGEQKKFWLIGAMNAFSHIAAAKSREQGECVYNWYFGGKIAERNGLIEVSMEKYPDATPTAVLLALTERACGRYRD